jgi:hypothetical protein
MDGTSLRNAFFTAVTGLSGAATVSFSAQHKPEMAVLMGALVVAEVIYAGLRK